MRPGAGLVIPAVALLAALAGCEPLAPTSASGPHAREVEQLVARCQDAMLREACVAQQDRGSLLKPGQPAPSQVVFVAGVGAVDAQAYKDIRTAGNAMCGIVKAKCAAGWEGSACRTARHLWPKA